MTYNLSRIMLRAWKIYRTNDNLSFSECLHRAWNSEKAMDENQSRIEEAKAAAGVTEEVRTWSDWKKAGYEVVHGMKALFGCSLIWASKGDGATYKARFFGASQVQPITA